MFSPLDYRLFCKMFIEVISICFLEERSIPLVESDAKKLSDCITKSTGFRISPRTLRKYSKKVVIGSFNPSFNPSPSILNILAQYALGVPKTENSQYNSSESYWHSYRSEKMKVDKKSKVIMIGGVIFLFFAVAIGFLNLFSLSTETITVVRLINDENYLRWLKEEFERNNKNYQIKFEPALEQGYGPLPTPIRFDIYRNSKVDVFLGGNSSVHEESKEILGDIYDIIIDLKDSISYVGSNNTSIGFYYKLIGIAWRRDKFEKDWKPISMQDLSGINDSSFIVPDPNTSLARDFLTLLSKDGDSLNFELGEEKYKGYLTSSKIIGANANVNCSQLLARDTNQLATIAFVPTHDEIHRRKEGRYNNCVGLSIPEEAMLNVSCISAKKGSEVKLGVRKFISFALSSQSQEKLYKLTNKFPSRSQLLFQKLQEFSSHKPEVIDAIPENFEDILNNLPTNSQVRTITTISEKIKKAAIGQNSIIDPSREYETFIKEKFCIP